MRDPRAARAADCRLISCPPGEHGWTSKEQVPFPVRRVYFMQDVAEHVVRGEHAHRALMQLLVAVRGSFKVHLHDGRDERIISLNRPDEGLVIHAGVWKDLRAFSPNALCLVLASELFSEEDYIRSWPDFLAFKTLPSPA